MTAVLYCFGESGSAYKCALTATFAGRDWTPHYVDFFNGEARSPAFRALNPMAEVPVWHEGDLTLSQSGAIQMHIAEGTPLMGTTPQDRAEVLRWLFWDNHKLSGTLGPLRFLMNFLPPAKRPEAVITFQKARTKAAFQTLEHHLERREWIAGSSLSIADCACAGYLYYPEPFGFDRADWPQIDAWLTRLSQQPGWKHPYDMMPGRFAAPF